MEATFDQSYAHQKVYINDVAVPPNHTYTVTNNSPDGNGVNEGNDVIFTIKRATTGSNKTESTVLSRPLQGKANEDDFTELDITPVTFSAKEDIKTVSIKTKTDKVTDDNEDFVLLLFTSNEDAKEVK